MRRRELVSFSNHLNVDMQINVYGNGGVPILAFPAECKYCDDYEINGIIDALDEFISSGKITLYCLCSVDERGFLSSSDNYPSRTFNQEKYIRYVLEEAMPLIYNDLDRYVMPYVCGISMGAIHASICFFRRPDLFSGLLCLSGLFDTKFFFGNEWMDDNLYKNNPMEFVKDYQSDNPMLRLIKKRKIILCVGQGKWENDLRESYDEFRKVLSEKNIPAWFDYWGDDVTHDYPWWAIQFRYFMPFLIGN